MKTKISLPILCACLIFILTIVSCKEKEKAPGKWLKYGPPGVELSGVVVKENKFGPPNFGEDPKTDLKVQIFVLKLPEPINVEGDQNDIFNADSYTGISEIQLDQLNQRGKIIKFSNFLNKKVKIKGALFGRLMGSHDYKKVLIDVFEVSPENKLDAK